MSESGEEGGGGGVCCAGWLLASCPVGTGSKRTPTAVPTDDDDER